MIRDNPVLRREWLRFSRHWFGWLLALAAVWLGLSWILRHWLPMQYLGMQAWQLIAADTLQMIVRADLPIAFFIVYRCASDPYWHGMREEFALRFVAPREILFGKIAMPILVMATMNVFGVYLNYRDVLHDPTYDLLVPTPWAPAAEPMPTPAPAEPYEAAFGDPENPFADTTVVVEPFVPAQRPAPRGVVVSAGVPVTVFGLLEDFLYSAAMVLIAASQFLFRRDPIQAAMHALWRIALLGALIAVAGWAWFVASLALPPDAVYALARNPALEFLVANAVWFALVFPIELAAIAHYWRHALRLTRDWLEREEA